MSNSFLTISNDAIVANRLGRLQNALQALTLSTREDYQAAVYSLVNSVLNLGDTMQPLASVTSRPAIVGDLTNNLTLLNQDANDVSAEIQRIENSAASVYNLAAASQNSLRQLARSAIFASSSRQFVEAFIDDSQLKSGYSTNLDFNAGVATLPLNKETQLSPSFSIGTASVGSAANALSNLNSTVGTAFQWNGTQLQLILSFTGTPIVNRLAISLDSFDGLEITSLTSSPDGLIFDDVLADLNVPTIQLDATSGKYSGDVIIDFPPRYVQQMTMTIACLAGQASFGLKNVIASSRTYTSSATLVTTPITLSNVSAKFSTVENDFNPYCSITHQISYDGVNFSVIQPGPVSISTPFWYQALLSRSSAAFNQQGSALVTAAVGTSNQPYTIKSQKTTNLSSGVVEQTLTLANITGPVVFQDTPLPNTFRVQVGSQYLTNGVDYSVTGKILSFTSSQSLATITFQTSALGAAALAGLQSYYTPLLYEVRFRTGQFNVTV